MLSMLKNFLAQDEVAMVRKALAHDEWKDGRETAGPLAKRVKHNLQIVRPQNPELTQKPIFEAIRRNRDFRLDTYIRNASVPIFARYLPDMEYGPHTDDALMNDMRADIAVTVFLSEPDEYGGGYLSIHDKFGEDKIKAPAGTAVIYPATSVHEVTKVLLGVREVAVFWVQSMVPDHEQRSILQSLQKAYYALRDSNDPTLLDVSRSYQGLLRMWATI